MHQNCNPEYEAVWRYSGVISDRNVVAVSRASIKLILLYYSFFLLFISYFLSQAL